MQSPGKTMFIESTQCQKSSSHVKILIKGTFWWHGARQKGMALSKRAWRPRKRAWRCAMLFCFRFNTIFISDFAVRSYGPDTDSGYVCTVTLTLEIWPLIKVMTHPWVMDNNCEQSRVGTKLSRCEQTDGQTDRVIPIYYHNKVEM